MATSPVSRGITTILFMRIRVAGTATATCKGKGLGERFGV